MNAPIEDRDSDSGLGFRDIVLSRLATLTSRMEIVATKEDLAVLEGSLKSHAHQVAKAAAKAEVDHRHDICEAEQKKRESVHPAQPVMSAKGWDTIKYIATLIAAGLLGGGSMASVQQIFK